MSEYMVLSRECRDYFVLVGPVCVWLLGIIRLCRKQWPKTVTVYAIRSFFLSTVRMPVLLTEEEAFDICVMQKILPRIQGSSTSIKEMLCQLFELLSGQKIDANAADSSTASAMQKILDGGNVTYTKSAAKIKFMVQRFEEDGFTSYWL